jgi:hypothetical protein
VTQLRRDHTVPEGLCWVKASNWRLTYDGLLFRMQKTVSPAGERLRAEYEAKGKLGELAKRFHDRRIILEPLTDQPIISNQGASKMP